MLNRLKKHMKIIKTCNTYLNIFTLGLSVALVGPCLLDLQQMVDTDIEHIALIFTARSIGYLVGSISGGILLDIVKSKQAVMTFFCFFVPVTKFGIPWSRNVETLLGFMVINGFGLGAIETGGNVICIQLWGNDISAIFLGMHFVFGVGGLIAPLLAAPFLYKHEDFGSFSDNITYSEDVVANFSSETGNITDVLPSIPGIIYPFSIVGIFSLIVFILQGAVCCISPTEEESHQDGKKDNSDRSVLCMFFIVIFTFLLFFVGVGIEIGFNQTLTTYAVKGELHATTTTGSYITSAFWAAITFSRLASVYLAIKFSNLTLLISDICIVGLSSIILLLFMPSEWALWAASVGFGIGISSIFATGVGWLNTHINITSKITAIFTVGCAAGEMVVPFMIAYFIEIIPEMFVYISAASGVLMAIFVFILHFILKNGKKKEKPKTNECYVIDTSSKVC